MEPAKTITAVLFDWDGTLFDSAAASLRAFQKMFCEFGIAFTQERHDELYAPDWYGMYRALELPPDMWTQADRRWLHHYGEERPALIDGAAPTLHALRQLGLRLAIVSSGTRSRIRQELERLELNGLFDAVVCNEDVEQRKPHPEGLELAMRMLNCAPEQCCFVGDTPEDIRMGQTARVLTVAVPSGYRTVELLAECGPDILLAHVRELPGRLG
jgi:HAD superfamily hydrolase (TIGR01509 family)